jgi:hypothetical protein
MMLPAPHNAHDTITASLLFVAFALREKFHDSLQNESEPLRMTQTDSPPGREHCVKVTCSLGCPCRISPCVPGMLCAPRVDSKEGPCPVPLGHRSCRLSAP